MEKSGRDIFYQIAKPVGLSLLVEAKKELLNIILRGKTFSVFTLATLICIRDLKNQFV